MKRFLCWARQASAALILVLFTGVFGGDKLFAFGIVDSEKSSLTDNTVFVPVTNYAKNAYFFDIEGISNDFCVCIRGFGGHLKCMSSSADQPNGINYFGGGAGSGHFPKFPFAACQFTAEFLNYGETGTNIDDIDQHTG
jgi:hypothetical protein